VADESVRRSAILVGKIECEIEESGWSFLPR
jgi:hypothetical protein